MANAPSTAMRGLAVRWRDHGHSRSLAAMPIIAPTVTRLATYGDNAHIVRWSPLLNGDSGTPIEMPGAADRTVQIAGAFGAGGAVVIEGSLDGTTYATLSDPTGTALSKTAAGIEAVLEITRFIRPRVSAGDGTTSLTVHILLRRPT